MEVLQGLSGGERGNDFMSRCFIDWGHRTQIYCSRKDWNKDGDKLRARGDQERCMERAWYQERFVEIA